MDYGHEPLLVLKVLINGKFLASAMIDSGATSCFVDLDFLQTHQLQPVDKKSAISLTIVDGRSSSAGSVTQEIPLSLSYQDLSETIVFHVTKIASYDLILGKSWLKTHNPSINWQQDTLQFPKKCCPPKTQKPACPVSVFNPFSCLSTEYDSDSDLDSDSDPDPDTTQPAQIAAQTPTQTQTQTQTQPALTQTKTQTQNQSAPTQIKTQFLPAQTQPAQTQPQISCLEVSPKRLRRYARNHELQIYSVSREQVLDYLNQKDPSPEEEYQILRKSIPEKYHDLLPLFSRQGANQLPPHRQNDHEISLIPDAKLPTGPLYDMSPLELQALKKYLDENLEKGFIRPSASPMVSPVLFVRKPGSLRFCVDYRKVNDITEKNRYPLPRINESLQSASKGKIFTRLDLRAAYNLIRIKEGDEWKTAFRTRYGSFEYLVMPFGLSNAPATCQQFVNEVLHNFIDIFCVVYLDDILIYSDNQEEHNQHVRQVLSSLASAGLFVKGEKCEFDVNETKFVGFILSHDKLAMDPGKISAVNEWSAPTCVKGVQSFLGFANYYRRFIKDYSRICSPLFDLTKKDQPYIWTPACQSAFEYLKTQFTSAPILKHFDPSLETILETDASDRVVSGVLSQYHVQPDQSRRLLPVAYHSRKMNAAECNYGVGEKELLAIIDCLRQYFPLLMSLEKPVTILTDHKNLTAFTSKTVMNRRQARWALELSELPFTITYRPGSANSRADALTRRTQDQNSPEGDLDKTVPLIDPAKIQIHAIEASVMPRLVEYTQRDSFASSIFEALDRHQTRHPLIDLAACTRSPEGLLLVRNLAYIPDNSEIRLQILQSRHQHPAAGHPGQAAMFELITRDYWWPKMRKDIAQFIRNCETCQRIKPVRHAPYGFLKPIQVPQKRWDSLSMDFITGLPVSDSQDCLFVVVDRLSKMAHFIACKSTLDALGFARLFFDHVFKYHGLPSNIISDRGSLFTSRFSQSLASLVNVSQNLSTAFHPQTDGQTERVNAIVEQYIRAYCNYQQDNWSELLTFAEFSYNNTVSATTRVTPFFANYGFHPRYTVNLDGPAPEDSVLQDYSAQLEKLAEFLKAEMLWAQDMMQEQADKSRLAPPVLQPGTSVWLIRRFISTTRPSNKLDYKRLGPFTIKAKVSSHAYELDLPESMKVHPVFHVSLLEPAASDPFPGQVNAPPLPVIIDGEEEYAIEEILDVRPRGRTNIRWQYLVKWTGYPTPTWNSYESVADTEALQQFITRYPDKPGPDQLLRTSAPKEGGTVINDTSSPA